MLQARSDRGQPTEAIDNRPEVPEDLEWIWGLYWEAHGSRQCDMAPNPLLWTEIAMVLNEHKIVDDERMYARSILRRMDIAALDWFTEQSDKTTKSKGGA